MAMSARLLGLLALPTILLLVACEREASPSPTHTPTPEAAVVPTAAPTDTRAPESTPTPEHTRTLTSAEIEAVFASVGVTWRELFDVLGADEQACVRENLGEELDEVLDSSALSDAGPEGQVVTFRCLPPDLADSVFLAGLLLSMGVERQANTEERLCLEKLVDSQDTAAVSEMLATDANSAEAAAFAGKVLKCMPDLLIAGVIQNAGVEVEDVDDAALECMREAVQGISDGLAGAVTGQEEDVAEEGFVFLVTMFGCAPDLFGPGFGTGGAGGTGTPAVTREGEEYLANRTKAFVDEALVRYERDGREATLAYYNSPEQVDGQWYVFIVGEDDHIIAHYLPDRVGMDANVLEDSGGYLYGLDILEADETGRWVSYVFLNPETGEEQMKHSWVVRKDGLIFGSGWYE